ncbi:hypothetical protein GCM10022419_033360 [Nonomuraea rosea]|uniref:Uncharacterized protein n=1 Tax=Nonomuraea rosea TaxID=638574 RepID=A0ABP6WF28_9ACTN
MRRNPRLDIIKRALAASDLADPNLALNIYTALYGRPTEDKAPREQIDDAHRRRDFFGVIEAARAGQQTLEAQPWYPARHGDIVHIAYEGFGPDVPAHGETYIVEQPEVDGWFNLRTLAHSERDSIAEAGVFATSDDPDPLMEMWFEAGPHRLTIVRDGRVVHGGAK